MNLAKVQAVEHKRQRDEEQHVAAEITTLVRPKGEAGSATKGFNLQEAMGLEENGVLYNEILVSCVRLTIECEFVLFFFDGD